MSGHTDESIQVDESALTLEQAEPTILRQLAARDESATDSELLAVAVWDTERDNRGLSPDELSLETVQTRLRTTHLPVLDEKGLVEYDREEGTVALAVPPDDVETYL